MEFPLVGEPAFELENGRGRGVDEQLGEVASRSIPSGRRVLMKIERLAPARPARSFQTNRLFLRLSTIRFISRSMALLSTGLAPPWGTSHANWLSSSG